MKLLYLFIIHPFRFLYDICKLLNESEDVRNLMFSVIWILIMIGIYFYIIMVLL